MHPAVDEPLPMMALTGRAVRYPLGEHLVAELRQAVSDKRVRVGLACTRFEVHVCGEDEDPTVLVDPKLMLDGLGSWPAVLWVADEWVCVEVQQNVRYYLATMFIPTEPPKTTPKAKRQKHMKLDRTTS